MNHLLSHKSTKIPTIINTGIYGLTSHFADELLSVNVLLLLRVLVLIIPVIVLMVAATSCIAFAKKEVCGPVHYLPKTVPFAFSLTPTIDKFYHSTGCRVYVTLDRQTFLRPAITLNILERGMRGMRRSVTPISHDHIVDPLYMWNQCANGRRSISLSRFFALKSSQRSSDSIRFELFGAYTLRTNVSKDLTLAGMAGVVSLTASVDMEIDPSPSSPRRLIVSTMGSLSSRERKAVILALWDSQTDFPPQSAPVKWWKPNRAIYLCLPTYFTQSCWVSS